MTGFLHERELSRKTFLQGGGALIVGIGVAGSGFVGTARAGSPFASARPRFLANQVDAYVIIHADNTATILTGRTEVGQGTATGVMQIAGEELDMDVAQAEVVQDDT